MTYELVLEDIEIEFEPGDSLREYLDGDLERPVRVAHFPTLTLDFDELPEVEVNGAQVSLVHALLDRQRKLLADDAEWIAEAKKLLVEWSQWSTDAEERIANLEAEVKEKDEQIEYLCDRLLRDYAQRIILGMEADASEYAWSKDQAPALRRLMYGEGIEVKWGAIQPMTEEQLSDSLRTLRALQGHSE